MSLPVIIGLVTLGIIGLLIIIISGNKILKKKLSETIKKINHLNGRVDISVIESDLKKMSSSKWDKYVDDINIKFQLIDKLSTIKDEIKNYNEVISDLEKSSKEQVKKKVTQIIDEKILEEDLKSKYGEEIATKLINRDYFIGMTEDQLLFCRGKATKTEQEVLKTKTKIIHIYGNKNSGDIFTFVNGELERFVVR